MSDDIQQAAAAIETADTVVAFTGAGVSTASGIPDFRSEGGLWEQYDPAEFHYQRFKRDPGGFWEKRLEMYEQVFADDFEPNEAHETLVTLEQRGVLDTVITQNIDDLHGEAGTESLLEIHGNGRRVVCEECGKRSTLEDVTDRIEAGELPPRCQTCGGPLKPDVVLFGEELPETTMQQARTAAREADLFLAIGSSLTVEPAASLPRIAHRTGSSLLIVNLEATSFSDVAAFEFRSDVTETLPELAATLEQL
ncbi:MAG: NAD-dependent deacylase [Halovenus sp.]